MTADIEMQRHNITSLHETNKMKEMELKKQTDQLNELSGTLGDLKNASDE
jgi:hypothetical protein